ncbi:hypothetical protein [Novosphingobium sp. BW1]|uniref:hypothetical protein n=1 Tax=Novosphingobium sp. BW1 TaxID=2592621 RepID=UPI0011DEB72E|nr:hypothetical protein [Novosphingobium sp. BW1]TYC89300.1 hypothetical protein FMM79_10190 [Novosphingobium sp. BW1]
MTDLVILTGAGISAESGLARANGAVTVEVNPVPTGAADILHVLEGPESKEVPRLVGDLLAGAHAAPF